MYNKYKGMSDGTVQLSVLQAWMLSHAWRISLISQTLTELSICYLCDCLSVQNSLPRGTLFALGSNSLSLPRCLREETFAETLVSLAWLMSSEWCFISTFSPTRHANFLWRSLCPHHLRYTSVSQLSVETFIHSVHFVLPARWQYWSRSGTVTNTCPFSWDTWFQYYRTRGWSLPFTS